MPTEKPEEPNRERYITLRIWDTGNAAFAGSNRHDEIGSIIRGAAERFESSDYELSDNTDEWLPSVGFNLYDSNGNRVGEVLSTLMPFQPENERPKTAGLSIEVGNAAFDEYPSLEIAKILQKAAQKIENGDTSFDLYDSNGNKVGHYEDIPVPSLVMANGRLDLAVALDEGRCYAFDDPFQPGVFVVTHEDYEPGYGDDEGPAQLVYADGEPLLGYEEYESVEEKYLAKIPKDVEEALRAISAGDLSMDDFERRFLDGEEDSPSPLD